MLGCMAALSRCYHWNKLLGKVLSIYHDIMYHDIVLQAESSSERVRLSLGDLRERSKCELLICLFASSCSSSELGMQGHFKCAASRLPVGQSFQALYESYFILIWSASFSAASSTSPWDEKSWFTPFRKFLCNIRSSVRTELNNLFLQPFALLCPPLSLERKRIF